MADNELNRFLGAMTTAQRLAFTFDPPTVPGGEPAVLYTCWDTDKKQFYAYDTGTSAWVAVNQRASNAAGTTPAVIQNGDLWLEFSGSPLVISVKARVAGVTYTMVEKSL